MPLLFFGPAVPRGVRLSTPVSLVDVLPTILDLLGQPTPRELDGRSLRPLWEHPERVAEPRALFIEADMDPPGPTARTMVPGDDLAVRCGNFKLVWDPSANTARLYDLVHDPRETTDVSAAHAELAATLRAELERFRQQRADSAPAGALTGEDLQKLQDLGYAGPK